MKPNKSVFCSSSNAVSCIQLLLFTVTNLKVRPFVLLLALLYLSQSEFWNLDLKLKIWNFIYHHLTGHTNAATFAAALKNGTRKNKVKRALINLWFNICSCFCDTHISPLFIFYHQFSHSCSSSSSSSPWFVYLRNYANRRRWILMDIYFPISFASYSTGEFANTVFCCHFPRDYYDACWWWPGKEVERRPS